jgi:hypothetical protein
MHREYAGISPLSGQTRLQGLHQANEALVSTSHPSIPQAHPHHLVLQVL